MFLVTNVKADSAALGVLGEQVHLDFSNHYELLRALLNLSDSALLVAPFLYRDFADFFEGTRLKGKRIELITSCTALGAEELEKPFSLRSFGEIVSAGAGAWPSIALDQKLHSKIYVFFKEGVPFAGVITSANLTHSGLAAKHETGILTTNLELLHQAADLARSRLDFVSLNENTIHQLCSFAEEAAKHSSKPTSIDSGLQAQLVRYCTPSPTRSDMGDRPFMAYFIKVSGTSEEPIRPEDQFPWDEPDSQLTFSQNPQSIGLGSCVLEVAVGGACFLSYYASTSLPGEFTSAEQNASDHRRRWPYHVWASNLSLHYGKRWFERPLYYDQVISDFRAAHPGVAVTLAGKDHIKGAIQMHRSYFAVTPEFGRFAAQKIREWTPDQSAPINTSSGDLQAAEARVR